jgi:beta-lactamase regulating signal transducer with metallopeptidase domain
MNLPVETLNHWGGNFLNFAGAMLWQSSLLIAVLFALDFLFRHKIRASLRYALWLVLLLKLILPPTLALPTSPAWWWLRTPAAVQPQPRFQNFTVTYDAEPLPEIPQNLPAFTPPQPKLALAAWALVISVFVSLALGGWLLARWWQIARIVRRAAPAENFSAALSEAWQLAGAPSTRLARFKNENQRAEQVLGAPKVGLKIVAGRMSPAVCGLFRPVILLPRALAENLSAPQLQAVLLHEIFHLRRRDVWVNLLQSLLQIIYWWQPLVWLANARIRRVREEAVDDAVMLALRDDAESYAPTLLAVAKLALNRPLASLGLVGILESRSALRQRIERLLDFRAPKTAGLTFASLLAIGAFSAVALPMGEGPATTEKPSAADTIKAKSEPQLALNFELSHFESEDVLRRQLLEAGVKIPPTIIHDFNNGVLFARGTKGQLVLVQQMIWRLNGYSSQEVAAATNIPGYAIKIPVDEPATPRFFSRTFKINMDVVYANLLKQSGTQSNTVDSAAVSVVFRELFTELGLNLESPPGKSIFYNEQLGKLFTKATASDLDVIECVVAALLHSSAQNAGGDSPPVKATQVVGIVGVSTGSNFLAATNIFVPVSKTDAGRLAQDGKLFYEAGKLDWAAAKLKAALALDPENATAKHYLKLVQTNGHATNKVTYTGPGRQSIINKLDHIRLDNVSFDNLPLREVLRFLAKQSKLRDPQHEGVNFLINPNPDKPGQTIDPATGLPLAPTPADTNSEPVDLGGFIVKIPNLTNVRLADVLDAIVTVCDHPIKYSIHDFAVIFSVKGPEMPQLFSRVFKVEPNVFYRFLENFNSQNLKSLQTNGNPQTIDLGDGRYITTINPASNVSAAARKFFTALGVNLDAPPGKSVFFNDRLGKLFVKATAEDLDMIERALSALEQTTPQTQVVATNPISSADGKAAPGVLTDSNFVAATRAFDSFSTSFPASFHPEATGAAGAVATNAVPLLYSWTFRVNPQTFYADLKRTGVGSDADTNVWSLARKYFESLGVNWESPPGKAFFYGDKRGNLFVKATESDLDKIKRGLSVLGQVTPQVHIKARFIEVPKGTLSGLPKMVAGTSQLIQSNQRASVTGILTDKNFRIMLRSLEAHDGVKFLAEPEVTTTSGRQTQMRATQIVTVITNMAFYDVFTNQDGLVVSNSIVPQTSQLETGPILDVVPYVLSDGYTINLSLIPSLTEFLGYDKPTNSSVAYNRAGEKIDVPRVLPRFATQQTVATLNLWDGQTVIIGGMTKTNTNVIVDKVPVLGDLPAGGIRFSSTKKEVVEDEILVFVTATIVDPAGNRVHSDEEMKSFEDKFPPQPSPVK